MIVSYLSDMTKTTSSSSSATGLRGRPREFDVNQALDGAIPVFAAKGFNGVSVPDLARAMGVSAGSLYKAFPDKKAIFVAALERYIAVRRQELEARLKNVETARQAISEILHVYADLSFGPGGRIGCLVVASNVELSSTHQDIAERIARQLSTYERRFADLIGQGHRDASIPGHVDPQTTATLLLCITQGMRVIGKTGLDHPAPEALVQRALSLLD